MVSGSTVVLSAFAMASLIGIAMGIIKICYRNATWERVDTANGEDVIALISPRKRQARALKLTGNAFIGGGVILLIVALLQHLV